MSNNPTLTLRIQADANGAIHVISQAAGAVNELGQRSTQASGDVGRLGTIIHNTGNTTNNTTNIVNNYNQSLRNTQQAATTASGALNALKSIMGGLSVAFTAKQILSEISSFETKLLSLKALTMANTEQMKQMETQARQLGATTAFSAQQAAEAQGVLASAGLKVNEILTATPKILQLAAAGNLDLAKAAEYSISTMRGLGLTLGDLGHINNVFAKVAADSSTSVEQVGEAMKTAAPVSKSFGISIETLSAAIGILANGQIKGSEAGNNFKSMLGALGSETKDKTKILQDHHLAFKDLDIQLNGTSKVMETIRKAGFSGGEALTLFGQDAAAATLILAENAAQLKESEAGLKMVGETAQEQADILNQGLAKAWDSFKGSLFEAALQFGEVKAGSDSVLGGLTQLIQTATGVIAIYEGMGEQFKESNKLTSEQYQNLQNISGELRVIAGGAAGVGALTAALWAANRAGVALSATLALVSRHPVMMFAGVLAGAAGAAKAQISEWDKDIEGQIKHTETRIKNFKEKSLLGGALRAAGDFTGFDIGTEENKLARLKKMKSEQESAAKAKQDAEAKQEQNSKNEAENQRKKAEEIQNKIKKEIEARNKAADATDNQAKSHKGLSEAQKAANKEQETFKRLTESTAIGAYNAKMAELNNALAKGGITVETHNDLTKKAAAEYEKATVDLNAYNNALRERQRLFDSTPRGKFEKGMDDLRAQKPYMSESGYLHEQDKLNVNYLKDTGLDPNAKTQADKVAKAGKDAKKVKEYKITFEDKQLTDALTRANKGAQELKAAFGGVGEAIGGINVAFTEYAKNQFDTTAQLKSVMEDKYATETEREIALENFKRDSSMNELDRNTAFLSATKKLFGEKSKAGQALAAAEKVQHIAKLGFMLLEMSMEAKSAIQSMFFTTSKTAAETGLNTVKGVGAVLNQGEGDPYSAFPRMAAMAALVAALGVFIGGGSSAAPEVKYGKTTGTVLGDSEAQSHSIQTLTDKLDEIHAREYPELRKIVDSVRELNNAQDSMLKGIVRTGGIKLATAPSGQLNDNSGKMAGLGLGYTAYTAVSAGMAGAAAAPAAISAAVGATVGLATFGIGLIAAAAVYALSKVPIIGDIINGVMSFIGNGLFGKVTKSVVGGGIRIKDQNLGSLMDDGAIDGNIFTVIETKKSSWFKTTRKYSEVLTNLGDEFSKGLGKVIMSMAVAVGDFWDYLGKDAATGSAKLREFIISSIDIKTFGLKDTEIQDALKNYTSMTFDKLVEHMVGAFVEQFQKLGETAAEAMGRVMTETVQYKAAITAMGADVSGTNESMVIFTQSMANMAGGIKNLISLTNEFTNKFTSAEKKAQISKADIQSFITPDNAALLAKYGLGNMKPVQAYLDNYDTASSLTTGQINDLKNNLYDFGIAIQDKAKATSDANNKYATVDAQAAYKDAFEHKNPNANKKTSDAFDWINSNAHMTLAGIALNDSTTTAQARAYSQQLQAVGNGWNDAWLAQGSSIFEHLDGTFGTNIKNSMAEAQKVQSSGIAALNSLGLPTDKAAFDSAKASSDSVAKPLESLAVAILSLVPSLDNLGTNIEGDAKQRQTIEEQLLKAVTTPEATTARGRASALDAMKETGVILRSTLSVEAQKQINLFAKTTAGASMVMKDSAGQISLTNKGLQSLAYWAEDTAKSVAKLKDSTKYLLDFGRAVGDWAAKLRATALGSTETQLKAAQAQYEAQLNIIKNSSNGEDKRAAMNSITGIADQYMAAIKNYYGSNVKGQELLNGIVQEVSGLGSMVSVQDLQLGVLQQIRDGVYQFPTGMEKIVNQLAIFRDRYNANPTVENAMRLDAIANLVLTINRAALNGADSAFISKLIDSVQGDTGLFAQIRLVISDANLTQTDKDAVISKLQTDFGAASLEFENFTFDAAKVAQQAIEIQKALKIPTIVVTANVDDAKTIITGLQNGALKDLNGTKATAVVDVSGRDKVVSVVDDAGKKIVDFSKVNGSSFIQVTGGDKIELDTQAAKKFISALDGATAKALMTLFGTEIAIAGATDTKAKLDVLDGLNVKSIVSIDGAGAIGTLNEIINTAKGVKNAFDGLGSQTGVPPAAPLSLKDKYGAGNSVGTISASKLSEDDKSLLVTLIQNEMIKAGVTDWQKYNESNLMSVQNKNGLINFNWDMGGAFALKTKQTINDSAMFAPAIPKEQQFPAADANGKVMSIVVSNAAAVTETIEAAKNKVVEFGKLNEKATISMVGVDKVITDTASAKKPLDTLGVLVSKPSIEVQGVDKTITSTASAKKPLDILNVFNATPTITVKGVDKAVTDSAEAKKPLDALNGYNPRATVTVLGTDSAISQTINTKKQLDTINGLAVTATVAVNGSGAISMMNNIISTANQTASALSALGVAQSNYAAQQVAAAQAASQAAAQAQAAATAQAQAAAAAQAAAQAQTAAVAQATQAQAQMAAIQAQQSAAAAKTTVTTTTTTKTSTATAVKKFAVGGAFTNGIVDQPTYFNMGLMGEAGSEGILPLTNINGSLGVNAILPAANEGGGNDAELIVQLREQNAQLREQNGRLNDIVTVLQAGFGQVVNENKKQTDSLEYIERKTRINAK